ncbi:MAG: hypothetical protein QOD24_2534 [Solirubrobacteraceae bacterium]|nr:hypothetical protein [Solirubrobacteraceae bacterium]
MGDAIRPSAARAGVTFEVERLERDGDQLVVSGHWSGLRGVRFVRPTLVVGDRQVLATLEHKPWTPRADRAWTAAFPWKGRTPDASQLALAVAPSVTVPLGEPAAGAEPTLVLVPESAEETDEPAPAKRRATKGTARKGKRAATDDAPVADDAAPEAPKVAPKRARAGTKARVSTKDTATEAKPEREPAATEVKPLGAKRAARATATAAKPTAAEPARDPSATTERMRARVLEQELAAVVEERDALRRKLDEAEALLAAADTARVDHDATLRRERRSSAAATDERDEIARARTAAERDRELARAQRDEAVKDREAAVRARTRMDLQREEAVEAQAAAEAAVERAQAERDEANAQRDEVLLAYRALQRHVQTERADLDRALSPDEATGDEPLGVRKMPAARTLMAELQRPAPKSKFVVSKFDIWVIRLLGTVAAACFILLLVSIVRVFI